MLKNYNKHEDLGYERNVNIMEKIKYGTNDHI